MFQFQETTHANSLSKISLYLLLETLRDNNAGSDKLHVQEMCRLF